MLLRDEIPEDLLSTAEQAVTWLNQQRGTEFSLTGLADEPDDKPVGEPTELGLVLCQGDLCTREQVSISQHEGQLQFALATTAATEVPALLDPPAGHRRAWLDEQLAKHEFLLILFYRGRW